MGFNEKTMGQRVPFHSLLQVLLLENQKVWASTGIRLRSLLVEWHHSTSTMLNQWLIAKTLIHVQRNYTIVVSHDRSRRTNRNRPEDDAAIVLILGNLFEKKGDKWLVIIHKQIYHDFLTKSEFVQVISNSELITSRSTTAALLNIPWNYHLNNQ